MNISSVNVTITSGDLLGILKDVIEQFVPVKGLEIEEVKLDNSIFIKGKYKSKVNVNFEACLDICSVVNNMIKIKINKIKVGKFKVFKFLTDFALKKALEQFKTYGIFVDKEYIIVALDSLYEFMHGIKFNILSINVDNTLKVEVDTLNIDLKKLMNTETEDSTEKKSLDEHENLEGEVKNKEEEALVKIEDCYSEFRNDVIQKTPDKYEKIVKYAMIVPDLFALFVRLFKDKRVPLKTKVTVGAVIAYLSCPIDILPDFIPFVGKIDDVAIAFFGLNKILNEVPEKIIMENWQGQDNVISIVKEGVFYISNVIGAEKVSRVLEALKPKKPLKEEVEKGGVDKNA